MILERAKVVETNASGVLVETERSSVCGSCIANKGCGTASLARMFGERKQRVWIPTAAVLAKGEEVTLGLSEQALLRGALTVYLLPLVSTLAAAIAGQSIQEGSGEGLAILFGICAFALSMAWVQRRSLAISQDCRYQPKLVSLGEKASR